MDLDWSNEPGAYEIHLMRRINNPYFAEHRRSVSKEELDVAKARDAARFLVVEREFGELWREVERYGMTTPRIVGDAISLREHIEEFIRLARGSGQTTEKFVYPAQTLREGIISDLRAASVGTQLNAINAAVNFHEVEIEIYDIPTMAQMRNNDNPIPAEETLSTILSEEPFFIAAFCRMLPEEKFDIRLTMLQMLKEAFMSGYVDPKMSEKIAAVKGGMSF